MTPKVVLSIRLVFSPLLLWCPVVQNKFWKRQELTERLHRYVVNSVVYIHDISAPKIWLKAETHWCWTSILVLSPTLHLPLPLSEAFALVLELFLLRRSDSLSGGGPFPTEQLTSVFLFFQRFRFHFLVIQTGSESMMFRMLVKRSAANMVPPSVVVGVVDGGILKFLNSHGLAW